MNDGIFEILKQTELIILCYLGYIVFSYWKKYTLALQNWSLVLNLYADGKMWCFSTTVQNDWSVFYFAWQFAGKS